MPMPVMRPMSAKQFALAETWNPLRGRPDGRRLEFLDYMDFAERYADYIAGFEKAVDRGSSASNQHFEMAGDVYANT